MTDAEPKRSPEIRADDEARRLARKRV